MDGDIVTQLLLNLLIESRQESCVCAYGRYFSRPSRSPLSPLIVAWTSLASVGKVMVLDGTVVFTVTRFISDLVQISTPPSQQAKLSKMAPYQRPPD